jgi:hypothetical protein
MRRAAVRSTEHTRKDEISFAKGYSPFLRAARNEPLFVLGGLYAMPSRNVKCVKSAPPLDGRVGHRTLNTTGTISIISRLLLTSGRLEIRTTHFLSKSPLITIVLPKVVLARSQKPMTSRYLVVATCPKGHQRTTTPSRFRIRGVES